MRTVRLRCPVCANDQFSAVDNEMEDIDEVSDNTCLKCSDCGAVYTKAELIADNNE